MINNFAKFLQTSYTPFHAIDNACQIMDDAGFKRLKEGEKWSLLPNTGYYITRNGSSFIAFKTGDLDVKKGFNIVASHTDSPCLKLKNNCMTYTDAYAKINVETYGGGLMYSMLDRPLRIAGRVVLDDGQNLNVKNVVSDFVVTIPSVAIHQQRDANDGLKLNPQIDMLPLVGMGEKFDIIDAIMGQDSKMVVDYDLYVVPEQSPYYFGVKNEFFASPRLDDLTGVYGGLIALIQSQSSTISVCACFDNEEVGSGTKQGAGGTLLKDVLNGIVCAVGDCCHTEELSRNAISNSFLVSMDNAHSLHPNHPEKCDITNRCLMNKGIVIKHHANQSYLTDGLSSAVLKQIFKKSGIAYQDFYNRSDVRSGGTLGAISNKQVSLHTVDIGLAQLAMHSFVETIGKDDFNTLIDGLKAFYSANFTFDVNKVIFE